jgi:hypothetical protein
MGDFSRELLARLEAAHINSPAVSHPRSHAGSSSSSGGSLAPVGGELGGARRALWPGELSLAGSLGSLGGSSGSPGSSGCPTPRSAGLLEALLTSDGSPRADATAAAAAAAARAATAPLHYLSSEHGGEGRWSELPADVWRWVALTLSPADVKSARLVCADWHAALSSNVQLLRPRQLRCTLAAASFPSLQVLELSQCRRLQGWELEGVRLLATLRCVSLRGCEGVTDDGIAQLAALPRLARLVLRNCVKLTDVGLAKLAGLSGRELPQLWAPAGAAAGAVGSPPPVLLRSPGGTRSLSAAAAAKPPPPRPPLASLDLAGCVLLTERGFAALASGLAGSLTQLAIGGCSRVSTVSDAVLAEVARCTHLRALDMAGCTHVTDEGVAHLASLHRLTALNLWNCLRVTESGLSVLRHFPLLEDLSLRGCQQLQDGCLAHLAGLTRLARLDMRACEHLRGVGLTQLSRLQQLRDLNLKGCYSLVDDGVELLSTLRSLTQLNLQECWQVTDRGLEHLSGLSRLEDLNLQGCRNLANPGGGSLSGLPALRGLTALCMRGCDRLTGVLFVLSGRAAGDLQVFPECVRLCRPCSGCAPDTAHSPGKPRPASLISHFHTLRSPT